MNFIEQESKVITKLLRDTINRKILWQRHPNLVLQDASIATNNLISPPKDGVYTTNFKNRIFQIYVSDSNENDIILELSRENSNHIDTRFYPTSALIDLYNVILTQDSRLFNFFNEFLMS